MATKAKEKWHPKWCQSRYATLYEIVRLDDEHKQESHELPPVEPLAADIVEPPDTQPEWCPCCMKRAIEPMSFPCGHTFCRSCIAHARPLLIQDYPKEVRDKRAVMQCPLSGCTRAIQSYLVLNGDIRFVKQNPRDSVTENFHKTSWSGLKLELRFCKI